MTVSPTLAATAIATDVIPASYIEKEALLGAVLTIQGKQYDVEKDFTWAELMLVEELGGVPLGQG
jgi:hypothetical protein